MGGQSRKRRRTGGLWVWAWRNRYNDYVSITLQKPTCHVDNYTPGLWVGVNATSVCPRVFNTLTGLKASKARGMKPVHIYVPAWTVEEISYE